MISKVSEYLKKNYLYILAVAVFILITVFAVIYEQSFIRLLPIYASIIIRMLHSRANRYGYLFGGVNQILYGLTYLYYNLYSSMLYAFLISFPIQIITFIAWTRKSYKCSTRFRALSVRGRLAVLAIGIAAYAVYTMVMLKIEPNANQPLVDCASFILGIACSALTILSFIEYTYLSIVYNLLSLTLYVLVAITSPEMLTYVVFGIYAVTCAIMQFLSVKKIYAEQTGNHTEI